MLWIVPLLLIPLCSANSKNSSSKVSLICEISDDRDFILYQWLIGKLMVDDCIIHLLEKM